ncbi:MAG: GTP-binding protein [Anaeroplasmataceae bacterium]|nr:GTP-binding protein [Anaeroplasmataceae bacterium]
MKIDIISGFLGAGKTTFIKRLLNTNLKNEKVVLIENEFGEVSVDSDFLADSKIDIKELSQGCICCSLFGDFSKSLNEVVEKFSPDRILIEPSGVGKLSDIIQAVADAHLEQNLNALVCMVDASKAKMYSKNFGEFFLDQIKSAHTVILSRTDVAKEEKVSEALEIIREHNHDAVIVTTPIATLTDEELCRAYEGIHDSFLQELLEELEHEHHHHHHDDEECECGHHHHHEDEECECGHHHHHHHADEIFSSVGFETAKKYDIAALKNILDAMSKGTYGLVVRAKGVVPNLNGAWYEFNLTPEEVEVKPCSARPIGKICVIGSKIDEHQIKDLF